MARPIVSGLVPNAAPIRGKIGAIMNACAKIRKAAARSASSPRGGLGLPDWSDKVVPICGLFPRITT